MIDRRTLIGGLGSAFLSARTARAQAPSRIPVVGFLGFASAEADRPTLEALRRGLAEVGRIEGRTVAVISRHAAGNPARAAEYLDEMARMPVDVFLSPGPAAARAIRRATSIPVVGIGLPPAPTEPELFTSLARPGGSVTGFSTYGEALSAKRIETVRELLPGARLVGILHNASDPTFRDWGVQTEASARAQNLDALRLGLLTASREELARHFAALRDAGGSAIIVVRDFLTTTLLQDIVEQGERARMPVVAEISAFVHAGALMSFGPDLLDLFRRSAAYIDRILDGVPPGELPIQLPTKLELALNLSSARALGVTVPPGLIARADEIVD